MIFKKRAPAQAPPGMKFVAFKTCIGNGLEGHVGMALFPEGVDVDEWGEARGDHFADRVTRPVAYFLPRDGATERGLEKIKREVLKRTEGDQSRDRAERDVLKLVNGGKS